MVVVKVGGSLYDHPRLGPGLREYLAELAPAPVLLVPGGGAATDAVRAWDRVHGLGAEAAHWVAVRSLSAAGELLARLLFDTPERFDGGGGLCGWAEFRSGRPTANRPPVLVLDPHPFADLDDVRDGALPHTWDVTTDSIAARVAAVFAAERLVLLKSADIPAGTPWETATERGWVDRHFPRVVAAHGLHPQAVNFRARLDARR